MVSKKRSRADEEEEPAAAAAEVALAAIPKRKSAESQVALILQALQNGDTGMLGDALQADAATVTSTVARLPTSSVLPFLEAVLYHMQGKPARVASLASWIRALLAQHADLLACPSLQPKLAPLYELIDERLAAFKPLLKLVGRMQMLQSQLVAQQTATQQEGGAPSDPVLTFDETCDASNFTLDLGDTHCPELSPSSTAAATADECMKACCATDGCETYQYCAEGESCGHGYWFEAGALSAGGDLDGWPQNTTLDKATAACTANATCHGMTYHEADPSPSGVLKIWLKTAASGRTTDTTWSRLLRAAPGCYLGQLHRACANATGDGWQSKAKPPPPVWLGFVSAIFGDHMVLQRAPQQAVIWGHTTPGATVTVELDQSWSAQAPAADDGVWRVTLPATAASLTPHSLSISASTGESAQLCDVLFGEVYLCGGQSNMVFSLGFVTNATEEVQAANGHPDIRLFTVGQGTSSEYPLGDLQTVEQNWTIASNESVSGGGIFGHFSSVCWLFGVQLKQTVLPADVPLGLVSNNWGGTRIEQWSTAEGMHACGRSDDNGNLFNAMIAPYTVGPMTLRGFTWYQGESNTQGAAEADAYACLFPSMITTWRSLFRVPTAFFGFIQLSTWCGPSDGIARMRQAQMAALRLPKVGYATNADHGAGCNIHPPSKQFCSTRLATSALALEYGRDVSDEGLELRYPANYVDGLDCTDEKTAECAWASVSGVVRNATTERPMDDFAANATATIAADGRSLVLTYAQPPLPLGAEVHINHTAYGWGAVPLLSVYDKGTGLPVLPWSEESVGEALL